MPKPLENHAPNRGARVQQEALRLDYVHTLTDDTGMIQHGLGGIPDRKTGYTTDDNVRAFLATVRLWRTVPELRAELEPLIRCYLGFLGWVQLTDGPHTGWFVNFVSYDRHFLEDRGSEDSLGRCLWVLGEALSGDLPSGCAFTTRTLWRRALTSVHQLTSPRAIAYSLIGLAHSGQMGSEELLRLAAPLKEGFGRYASEQWQWFEPYLTYDNARMVEAVWRVAEVTGDPELERIARKTLDFLTQHSFQDGMLMPVGNRGWWKQGEEKAVFDQQTIEAGAYVELYQLVGDEERALRSMEWFHGRNAHRLPVYDSDTGACYDGLTADGINLNQGAESVLSYLLAASTLQP